MNDESSDKIGEIFNGFIANYMQASLKNKLSPNQKLR